MADPGTLWAMVGSPPPKKNVIEEIAARRHSGGVDARGRSGGRCQGAAIGGCSRSTDSKVRLGSAELDGTSGDDGELDVTSGDEGEVDGTSGDLGGSLELGRRGEPLERYAEVLGIG